MINGVDQAHAHTVALGAYKQGYCLELMLHKEVVDEVLEGDVLVLGVVLLLLASTWLLEVLVQVRCVDAVCVSTADRT